MIQQRTVMGQVQQRPGQQVVQQTGKGGKPIKDPNAPKKPLSAYFLFSQEERLKVKAEFPDYSITEVAKELGRRWATIDPAIKQSYEQRYQESRRQYEQALAAYKPQKKKKDPNAPKQPLSAYFLFSQEERLKVKAENPNFSICEIAKELGRRWADMAPEVKQRYQQMAEEGRQKYDQDMAAYRQGNYTNESSGASASAGSAASPSSAATTGGAGTVTTTLSANPTQQPQPQVQASALQTASVVQTTTQSSTATNAPSVSQAGATFIAGNPDYTSLLN